MHIVKHAYLIQELLGREHLSTTVGNTQHPRLRLGPLPEVLILHVASTTHNEDEHIGIELVGTRASKETTIQSTDTYTDRRYLHSWEFRIEVSEVLLLCAGRRCSRAYSSIPNHTGGPCVDQSVNYLKTDTN